MLTEATHPDDPCVLKGVNSCTKKVRGFSLDRTQVEPAAAYIGRHP